MIRTSLIAQSKAVESFGVVEMGFIYVFLDTEHESEVCRLENMTEHCEKKLKSKFPTNLVFFLSDE